VGAFNGDGRQDLATANVSGTVNILINAGEDDCPNSDLNATAIIDGCNSGVANTSSQAAARSLTSLQNALRARTVGEE
jgi:hypothetical protein